MFARTSAILTPRIPFLSAHTFLRHEVRVRALQTRRHHRFVVINRYMVFRSRLNHLAVMTHTRLPFVPLQPILCADDRRHITGLDGMNAMYLMVGISLVQHVLVIGGIASGLVVTDDLYAQAVGQAAEVVHIPIVVGFGKGEMLPILPTFVPSFGQHGLDVMVLRKTQIARHVLRRSTMYRALLPRHGFHVHTPPDSDEFHGLDPRGIFDTAWFVEIQHDSRSDHGL